MATANDPAAPDVDDQVDDQADDQADPHGGAHGPLEGAQSAVQCPGEGLVRVTSVSGVCWHCGARAVAGERLPGRTRGQRHRVRLLCARHDRLTFPSSSSSSSSSQSSSPA